MFIITLPFEGATWGDLRAYVRLNADKADDAEIGLEIDRDNFDTIGLSERIEGFSMPESEG